MRNLQQDLAICEAATRGPWVHGISPEGFTTDELLEYLRKIVVKGDGEQLHMVMVKNKQDDYDDAAITAITGNGPTSEANAVFALEAREALPYYITRVRELEQTVVDMRDALRWCGGSPSFAPEGEARKGWVKLVEPLLDGDGNGEDGNE